MPERRVRVSRITREDKIKLLRLPVGGHMVFDGEERQLMKCFYEWMRKHGMEPIMQKQPDGRTVVWRSKTGT